MKTAMITEMKTVMITVMITVRLRMVVVGHLAKDANKSLFLYRSSLSVIPGMRLMEGYGWSF